MKDGWSIAGGGCQASGTTIADLDECIRLLQATRPALVLAERLGKQAGRGSS